MPAHRETRELPYSASQMYALVADVGRYEEFLPWVVGTRVRTNSDTEMVADMIVGFKGLREQFTSRVVKNAAKRTIEVDYLDGPLKQLHNDWIFRDNEGGGSSVEFYVNFTFKNRMFEKLAGQMFAKALHKMTSAFVDRAETIYGKDYATPSGNSSSSATNVA